MNNCQAGEEAEAHAIAAAQAASLAQRDVQLQQLEGMKARIRADRLLMMPSGHTAQRCRRATLTAAALVTAPQLHS